MLKITLLILSLIKFHSSAVYPFDHQESDLILDEFTTPAQQQISFSDSSRSVSSAAAQISTKESSKKSPSYNHKKVTDDHLRNLLLDRPFSVIYEEKSKPQKQENKKKCKINEDFCNIL